MKKKSISFLLLVLLCVCHSNAQAYVRNLTNSNSAVHWADSMSLIDIFVNPSNTQGLSSSDINAIADASVAQWSSKSRITLRRNSTAGTAQEGLNEVYFSTDPSVFNGSGVVGVTQVFFKNNTGEILEADILINDTFTFSTNINEVNYLGNVLTHEMGHFLGLGHGQVAGSTMLYALARGENQVSDDDIAGLYSLYPNGDSARGSLTGKIVGGKSLIGVFGTHVQAISLKTGKVAGSVISDLDGSFKIDGLKKNDQYYIYTNPIVKIGLPAKYDNTRFDFCAGSKPYRGSFFQSCGAASEGHPQAVKLNANSVSVGNITIRCNLDVPPEYMQGKNITPATYDIQNDVVSGIGNSFTGFFSSQELTGLQKDYFKIDYSNIDWNALGSSGTLYLELKIINQALYSPFKAEVSVTRSSTTTAITPKYVQEADGWISIDTVTRIPINRSIPSDNVFEISIQPKQVETTSAGLPYVKTDYFPASGYFEDSMMFYLVSASIVSDNGSSTYSLVSSKNEQLSDNTQCPDAANTYALSSYAVTGTASSSNKKKDKGIACGTVDMSGGPGNGPGGFFIGLIFSLILCHLTTSIIRNNKETL